MSDSGLFLPTVARPGDAGVREWIRQAATIWNGRLSIVSGVASTAQDSAASAQSAAEAAQSTATSAVEQVPATGDFRLMALATYDSGWLACDGSDISRVTYSDLFDKIGETYGAGNGSSTFTLPTIKAFVLENDTGFSLDTMEKSTWTIVIKT